MPDFFPAWSNLVPDFKLAMLPTFSWEAALYQAALGMPSTAVLMPSASVYGKDHVLVRTPSRSYTVGQQKQLLKDMGDEQAVRPVAVLCWALHANSMLAGEESCRCVV